MLKTTKEPDSSRLLIGEPMAYTLSTVFCLHVDERPPILLVQEDYVSAARSKTPSSVTQRLPSLEIVRFGSVSFGSLTANLIS